MSLTERPSSLVLNLKHLPAVVDLALAMWPSAPLCPAPLAFFVSVSVFTPVVPLPKKRFPRSPGCLLLFLQVSALRDLL